MELSRIAKETSHPALLENMAEECVELAHACLKMARIIRNENPTPMRSAEVMEKIEEEMADVNLLMDVLMEDFICRSMVSRCYAEKKERWINRLNSRE